MLKRNLKGQALVESVIIIPVLIFFLLCIIQIGILFNTYYIVNYASFCGARSAVVHTQMPDNPKAYAYKSAMIVLASLKQKEIAGTRVIVNFYYPELEVVVIYPVKLIVPILGGLLPYIPVTASTRLPIEK